MADEQLKVVVKAATEGVPEQLRAVAEAVASIRHTVEGITNPVKETIEQFKKLGEAFLVFEAVEKIEAFIEKLEDMATVALKLSAVLGTTVEKVSEFRGVLVAVGGNEAAGTVRTMEHLQRVMSESMSDSTSHAAQAFRNLGISAQEVQANMNNFPAMMARLRQAFQEHQQGANLTANFYAILGRQFDSLIPVLRLTDSEFEKAQEHFKHTGSNIAPFSARLFESGEMLRFFEQSLTGVSLHIYGVFQPAIDGLVKILTDVTQWFTHVTEKVELFLETNTEVSAFSRAFTAMSEAIWSVIEPFEKLIAAVLKVGGNVALKAFLSGTISLMQNMAVAAVTLAYGMEAVSILYDKLTKKNVAAEEATQLKRLRDYTDTQLALNRRDEERTEKRIAEEAELVKKLADLDSQLNKKKAEAAAEAATNTEQILKRELNAYETFVTKVKSLLGDVGRSVVDSDPAETAGLRRMGREMEADRINGSKTPPPLGGKGGGKDPKNYIQEWRDALDEELTATTNFFRNSKARELEFWKEKLEWTKAHSAEIIKTYEAEGLSAVQAKRKQHQMELQLKRQVFALDKEEANRDFQEKNKKLNDELQILKDQLQEKTISETQWYARSQAIQEQQKEMLRKTGQENTAAWDDMLRRQSALEKEHLKNIAEQWTASIDWITSKWDTMLTGVLQGTQTWEKAWNSMVRNMAISFIEAVAKMMLKWIAFQATTALGMPGVAKAIGNPFENIINNVMTMFSKTGGAAAGGAAGTGVAAAGAATADAATSQLTKAVTANTTATASNTGGILNWVGQQLSALGAWLGLTAATTTETAATEEEAMSSLAMSVGLDANTVSMETLVAALVANTEALMADAATNAIPLAVGAWRIPGDMHAYLHEGEMVIPKAQSEILRNGSGLNFAVGAAGGAPAPSVAGGGGGGNTIIIQAMDARSFQAYMQSNGHVVAQTLGLQARNNSDALTRTSGQGRRY